jgi:hypothetical protein
MKIPQQKLKLLALLTCFLFAGEVVGAETKILKRSDWKAQAAKENQEIRVRVEKELLKRRPAVYLTVHHSQTPATTMPFAEHLRKHQELMWHYTIDSESKDKPITTHVILRDTPYHFLINSTGEVAEGRELRFAAYSNTEYLTPIAQHITVVLKGDFDKTQPTDAQISSLIGLLADLAKAHNIKLENIGYHQGVVKKEVDKAGRVSYGTSCPGKNLIGRFEQIKAELSKRGVN